MPVSTGTCASTHWHSVYTSASATVHSIIPPVKPLRRMTCYCCAAASPGQDTNSSTICQRQRLSQPACGAAFNPSIHHRHIYSNESHGGFTQPWVCQGIRCQFETQPAGPTVPAAVSIVWHHHDAECDTVQSLQGLQADRQPDDHWLPVGVNKPGKILAAESSLGSGALHLSDAQQENKRNTVVFGRAFCRIAMLASQAALVVVP
jgi:hypothetical protein